MGLFENFPYTNLHDLNLDWILEEVKKLKEAGGYSPENPPPYPVTSVNGQTGEVVLFNEQEGVYVRFPDSDNPQWNIYRLVNGVPAGIQFSATLPAKRMQGTNRFNIYDEGNPPPYPVVSVNGKTGAVVLFEDGDGAYIKFPDTDNPQWNVYRIIDGQVNGIQFHKNGRAVRMQGDSRYEIYDQGNPPPYPVTSVNGLTGAAETPFTDHTDDVLEFVAGAVGASWGLKRTINTGSATDEAEVEFTLQLNDSTGTPEAYIASGETVKKLLTEDDIPSSSGVVSVNGLTGRVTLNGGNLPAAPDTLQTVEQAIAAEAQARTQADTSLNDNITNINQKIANVINPGGLSNNERYLPADLGTVSAANIDDFVSSYRLNTGNYKDIYPGCFIHIGDSVANTDWMVGGLGIKHNSGDTAMGHGAEFIPRNQGFAYGTQMNSSNTTAGGYKGCAMHSYLTGTVAPALQAVLGSHLLNQRVLLSNAVDTEKASYSGLTGTTSGWEWCDAKAVLMSEVEVFGSMIWGGPYDVGEARTKLPVFNFISPLEFGRGSFWLRAVASGSYFAHCYDFGFAGSGSASDTWLYVRPLIRIG